MLKINNIGEILVIFAIGFSIGILFERIIGIKANYIFLPLSMLGIILMK